MTPNVETINPFADVDATKLAVLKAQLAEAEGTLKKRTLDSLLAEATNVNTADRKARIDIVEKFVAIGYNGFGFAYDENGQIHCVTIGRKRTASNGERKTTGDLRGTFDNSNPPSELLALVLELDREIKMEKDAHARKNLSGKRDAKMRAWCEKQNLSW